MPWVVSRRRCPEGSEPTGEGDAAVSGGVPRPQVERLRCVHPGCSCCPGELCPGHGDVPKTSWGHLSCTAGSGGDVLPSQDLLLLLETYASKGRET